MVLEQAAVVRAFSRAAGQYGRRARVQAEIADRLLERLDGLKFSPQRIVDLGCGPGREARILKQRFPKARVLAMDLALPMLTAAGAEQGWLRRRFERVAGDANALPLADSSVDFVYSSLMLQWCPDLPRVLTGLRRVLRPGGLLLVSTFGPDTLKELRAAWARVDDRVHTHSFTDVQQLGDALVRAGFDEPVLDTDWVTSSYPRALDLMRELKSIGATNAEADRRRGLTGKRRMRAMLAAYEDFRTGDGRYPATWEAVYASAWAPAEGAPIRSGHGEEASVSVASIGRRRR